MHFFKIANPFCVHSCFSMLPSLHSGLSHQKHHLRAHVSLTTGQLYQTNQVKDFGKPYCSLEAYPCQFIPYPTPIRVGDANPIKSCNYSCADLHELVQPAMRASDGDVGDTWKMNHHSEHKSPIQR